jgi:hypothetical protein
MSLTTPSEFEEPFNKELSLKNYYSELQVFFFRYLCIDEFALFFLRTMTGNRFLIRNNVESRCAKAAKVEVEDKEVPFGNRLQKL